ncbi:MAG: hypothetical protein ACPG2Y_02755, partial [Acholeplasmataceae bacterium]
FIDTWDAESQQAENHPGVRMCEINQRCMAFEHLSIDGCVGINNIEKFGIDFDDNFDEMRRVAVCDASFDAQYTHELRVSRMDADMVTQFDNKGINIVCGMSQATAKWFCSICDANTDCVHQLPRPSTLCWGTRTVESKLRNLHNGLQSGNSVNLIESRGVQNQPLYDIPAHKHGAVFLHNQEGIWAITMDTYQDSVCPLYGHKMQWSQMQQHAKAMDDKFNEISIVEDNINATNPNTTDRAIRQWLAQARNQLNTLKNEYSELQTEWDKMNKDIEDNKNLIQFKSILRKHDISLYYMLPGSVQGVVCGKLCKAAPDLVQLALECNQTGAFIWAHLFNNLTYIYDMLKHKSSRNWTKHEMASVKTAYIDWYHLHIMVVKLWRMKGSVGVKCHYLVHDIETVFNKKCSTALSDDQRFENSNQTVDGGLNNYTRYKKNDKLHLLARKANTRTLNKPPRA